MIRIDRSVWERMADYCRTRLPEEACGALFGPAGADNDIITCFTPIGNAAASPATEFAFDAREWIYSLYEAERKQLKLVGVFHSHPRTSGHPSAQDIAGSLPGEISYWIVSFAGPDRPDIRAYRRTVDPRRGVIILCPIAYSFD
ncbi:M67 family metallopeptidase [Paenibacillus mesophilus]|uniref:M67 family metallopeptidase n=1 Tax=Paenibacillus mesophilus TaxID=2582849 RepID=UPI00110D591F|nr:M67 family metallopeptidase [Paenibacillus mesophilus]TMV47786.1 M67 family metallopeptidase [Paenibacillus mesophilus]